MTRRRPILLLDVDGVLLDLNLYRSEWDRLVDTVLSPLLGQRADGWAALSHAAWLTAAAHAAETRSAQTDPARYWSDLNAEWIELLCRSAGLTAPATAEARSELARNALAHFLQNTRAVVPGARETIVALSRRFELHMASGNPAFGVEAVLQRIGVRELIGQPFGSDLAGVLKSEPARFYGAIFERLGAVPQDAIVVDDVDAPLLAARALGAKTIKVGAAADPTQHDFTVREFRELPALLDLP